MIQIGNRIIARREELGLKQSELAIQADITQQTLSVIESGKRAARVDTLSRIAEALKIPLSSIQPEYLDTYASLKPEVLSLALEIQQLDLKRQKIMLSMFHAQLESLRRA
ncbi:MAG: helix-turn-helix transcriptional regulator [Solobacterium sp.]|nr:helix-turn-helix transcriptional regulator [Solobacterium sp.]